MSKIPSFYDPFPPRLELISHEQHVYVLVVCENYHQQNAKKQQGLRYVKDVYVLYHRYRVELAC